jgi:SAM-dependent methyltransferase
VLRRNSIVIGLFLVSAASLLFEILLTKFFGSKLEHHFTFAIISTAMLGFGSAGVYVHMRPEKFPSDDGPSADVLGRYAWAFAVSCLLVIPIFAFIPIDPLFADWRGTIALPLFFLMFAVPFFLVGVCVSYTLVAAKEGPGIIYFWDLLGAGIGAAFAATAISWLNGYGATIVVALLGAAGALFYWHGAGGRPWKFSLTWRVPVLVALTVGVLLYPGYARSVYGHDIFSMKFGLLRKALLVDFQGIEMSYWNAIARIDVSKTGDSRERSYRGGIAHRFDTVDLPGRFILVDGGASTRQFALEKPPSEQAFLKNSLWAAPYVPRAADNPPERALVIGAGGGVDILVSKAFGTKHIDAIELNPDTYRVLLGVPGDPMRDRYTPWILTDEHSTVNLMNTEARHYCHTLGGKETYDVIEASGVDTLTAIRSAANALSENFLYTQDAVADYYRLLKPGGILSLSHGYSSPATLTLRKFVTYLDFLDKQGVQRPGDSLVFIFDSYWENGLLKKGAFSREEVDRLEAYARINHYRFIYHPFQPLNTPPVRPLGDALAKLDDQTYDQLAKYYAPFIDPLRETVTQKDLPFIPLAKAKNAAEREKILSEMRWDVHPSTDERPYFYFVGPTKKTWVNAVDGASIYPQPAVRWMFVCALIASLALVLAPILIRKKKDPTLDPSARKQVLAAVPFFALSGFAFMLIENVAFLNLTLFVGGPLYSLSIVLPSVLIGYAFGSLLTDRYLVGHPKSYAIIVGLFALGAILYAIAVRFGMPHLIGTSWSLRVVVSVLLTLPLGALLGIPVPWYMSSLKSRDARSLAWMWAVSSAFNVLGSMLFVPICFAMGRTPITLFAAAIYLAAILWAGWMRKKFKAVNEAV